MMKRLFLALWPDEQIRSTIAARTSAVAGASGGKPVVPQNLHLTLAFLHSVDTRLLPCIRAAARRASGEPFSLTLDHFGYWPRANILWLGPRQSPTALTGLVDSLWGELAECGFTPERRPFRPHVTLARKAVHAVPDAKVEPIPWTVERFSLVESITGRSRPTYEVLDAWPLVTSSVN